MASDKDLDAIAKKHGGTATLDDLAAKHGGTVQSAEPYQSPVYPGGSQSRTASEVAQDQAANVLAGIPKAVTGIPGAVAETGMSLWDMITGKGTARAQAALKGTAQPAAPIVATLAGNPPSPESPEWAQAAEGAGALLGAAGLGAAGKAAGVTKFPSWLESKIPTTAKAGAKFQQVMGAAKDIPIDLTEANQIIDRAGELRQRGSSMPKVLSDFTKNRKAAATNPQPFGDMMTYEEGRDFASNAGDLSVRTKTTMNAKMKAQVSEFSRAMKTANREAAAKVGMGDLYDQAMKEWGQAKDLQAAGEVAKKYLRRAAEVVAGGAIANAGWNIYRELR